MKFAKNDHTLIVAVFVKTSEATPAIDEICHQVILNSSFNMLRDPKTEKKRVIYVTMGPGTKQRWSPHAVDLPRYTRYVWEPLIRWLALLRDQHADFST